MKRKTHVSKTITKKKVKNQAVSKPKASTVGKIEDVNKLIHLLQVNQVELEHQNQELRIAEAELEVSRNKYVNLFDFSPIPYFSLDPAGIIKEVNLSATKMFGIDRNKLTGKNIISFIPIEEKSGFSSFIKTVFGSPAKQSCKMKLINKDKRISHVLLEALRSDDTLESEQRCQIALIDLTEYQKLEESVRELSEQLRQCNTERKNFRS